MGLQTKFIDLRETMSAVLFNYKLIYSAADEEHKRAKSQTSKKRLAPNNISLCVPRHNLFISYKLGNRALIE